MIDARSFILVIALAAVPSLAYSSFQESLPNGNNVNHPCKVNYRWPGLGHNNPLGGGARNAFGLDFARLGSTWNAALCQLDSDGDGRTNGEELGDPNCVWQRGQTPQSIQGITHPGVCEPVDSPQCQGKVDFVNCEVEAFDDCEAINNPKVLTDDFVFPRVQIPNTETNYFCMNFDLPQDQDYHLVAYEPLIDNANVLHHILMYGCKDPNGTHISQPEPCGMSQIDNDCTEVIGLWAVGVPGLCFPENLGFRFGASGFKRVRMETHYNNPEFHDHYTDASGLRLYYQPTESQFVDLYTLIIGQRVLDIPPGQARHTEIGHCPSDCTRKLIQKPAFLYSAFNHMHYLGRAMKIELFRGGVLHMNITNEDFYSYDNPVEHIHTPAIQLLPGDELRTTCVFNSLSTDRRTYYGEGTNDEMCFGFLTIYPKDALPQDANCVSYGPMSVCDRKTGTPVNGCNWATFLNKNHPDTKVWWNAIEKNCNYDGVCRPECQKTYDQLMASEPCLQGEMKAVVDLFLSRSPEGLSLLSRLYSCARGRADVCSVDECRDVCDDVTDYVRDSAATMAVGLISTATVAVFAVFVGSY